MASEAQPNSKPSFSPWRKWSIGLNVVLIVLVVFSVVVMLNYLTRDYSRRFYVSSRIQHELSPQTLKFLQSLTNQVKVILYYDKNEPFYSSVASLLNEYHLANSRISVVTVDYLRDAGKAAQVKAQYKLNLPSSTNVIIFDCEGKKPFSVDGNYLTRYVMDEVPNEKEREFHKRPVEFNGEKLFTGALLAVTTTNQPHAYFLEGHGEHPPNSGDDTYGYMNFATALAESWIQPQILSLTGTRPVPMDGLLIIAGPRNKLFDAEVKKIDEYLGQGGRLFVLFNLLTTNQETGLEKLLAKWGVEVGATTIKDPDPDHTFSGGDIIVNIISNHPVMNPLIGMPLQMIEPRAIEKLRTPNPAADAPQVEELAATGPHAFASGDVTNKRAYPLIAAVEKGAIRRVITERGATRIVVAGDSLFLANHQIGAAANREFAKSAANWLLDRTQMLEGIGPKAIQHHRILMSAKQLQAAEWILVVAMPASMLLLGGAVWLRRRK